MSDDDDDSCGLLCCVLIFGVVFMTFGSPGFVLYGFFSDHWIIVRNDATYDGNESINNNVYIGLYRRCVHDDCTSEILNDTTFGLEVTSVLFLFLSILALPWFKACFTYDTAIYTCYKYWSKCFLPFLLLSGILSLSGSIQFRNEYGSKSEDSQVCAGLGGGFQIVLTIVIGCCIFKGRSDSGGSPGQVISTGSGAVAHQSRMSVTRSYIVRFFYMEETTVAANRDMEITVEQQQHVQYVEQEVVRY